MDRHGYYGGPHEGESAGYLDLQRRSIQRRLGAPVRDRQDQGETSFNLPIMDLAYNGKPSTISEMNWTPPNRCPRRHAGDRGRLRRAAGVRRLLLLRRDEIGWAEALAKFSISDPVAMGQFPATALIFRQGLVKRAGVALRSSPASRTSSSCRDPPLRAPEPGRVSKARRPRGAGDRDLPGRFDRPARLSGRSGGGERHRGGRRRQGRGSVAVHRSREEDRPQHHGRAHLGLRPWAGDDRRAGRPGGDGIPGQRRPSFVRRRDDRVVDRLWVDPAGRDGRAAAGLVAKDASPGHERGCQQRLVGTGDGCPCHRRHRGAADCGQEPRRARCRSSGSTRPR